MAETTAPNATDAAVELAREKEIDLATLTGTGEGSKITVDDVRDAVTARDAAANAAADGGKAKEDPKPPAPKKSPKKGGEEKRYHVKLTGTHPFSAVDVPGCEPTVVVDRTGCVLSADEKAALDAALSAKTLPIKKDDLVITELE